jgi:hypothetical protein
MSTYQVLTVWEKVSLSKISTTKEQAEQILERNELMLGALERLLRGEGNSLCWDTNGRYLQVSIGCPHCQGGCCHCAWGPEGEGCLDVTFGGVSGQIVRRDKMSVRAVLWRDWANLEMTAHPDPAIIERDADKCRTFIQGHIEWAEAIISGEIENWRNCRSKQCQHTKS